MSQAVSGSALKAIIMYAICSCLSFSSSMGKNFTTLTSGAIMISSVLTQSIGTYLADKIGDAIGLPIPTFPIKFVIYMFLMWIFNTIILTIDIGIQCKALGLKSAAINALGGAIAAPVAVLVWDILTMVVPPLKVLSKILDLPIIGSILGGLFDALILTIFNLIFGLGLGRTVALKQMKEAGNCGDSAAAPAPSPSPA